MPRPRSQIWNKLKKLRRMRPQEVFLRTREHLAVHAERLAYHTGQYEWSPIKWRRHLCHSTPPQSLTMDLADWWMRHLRERDEPAFLLDRHTLNEVIVLYQEILPGRQDELVAAAEADCRGRHCFLGIEFQANSVIDWQCDPRTGRHWPSAFYGDIRVPFCQGDAAKFRDVDAKYVWELNRHAFAVRVAQAYCLTKRPEFASFVFQTMASWSRANPYLQGINWTGPLEVAVRALTWIWAYQLCRDWRDIDRDDHLDFVKSLYRHGAYLHRHLEVYSSPNNHLVGEALALYLLGTFFPEFDEAAAWRNRGWDVLAAEPGRQFYSDGGSTEQSTSYHHYCLGFFVLAVLTRIKQGDTVPQSMLDRLERAFEFSMWMTTADGTVPRIGDADDSRSIRFGQTPPWDFRNLLCLGALLFERRDLKCIAGAMSEDALWLFGARGYANYQRLEASEPEARTQVFPESGYAIVRSGWGPQDDHLCFDCGPIGFGVRSDAIPETTHGHADLLSLTMHAHGHPVLVDTGFYAFSVPHWHRYCRDVQGHNTVRVDGASQALFEISNGWSHAAEPGPIATRSGPDYEYIEGSHSGFYNAIGGVRHRRAVFYKFKSYLVLLDRLEGHGTHFVEVFFHFAPGQIQPLCDGSGASVRTDDGICATVRSVDQPALDVQISLGQVIPDGGWIATNYGRCMPAPLVCFQGDIHLPATLTFLVTTGRGDEDADVSICTSSVREKANKVEGWQNLRLVSKAFDDLVTFDWHSNAAKQIEPYEKDSNMLFQSSIPNHGIPVGPESRDAQG